VDNKQKLKRLQSRIQGKTKGNEFLDIWNYLMLNYGWIPFEEFKRLDASIVNELVNKLNKMNGQQNRQLRRGR